MKVLILEDDTTGRTLLTRVINHIGAEVVEAANGLDGLVRLEKEDPDLAVIDLGMPREAIAMNGVEQITALDQIPLRALLAAGHGAGREPGREAA